MSQAGTGVLTGRGEAPGSSTAQTHRKGSDVLRGDPEGRCLRDDVSGAASPRGVQTPLEEMEKVQGRV